MTIQNINESIDLLRKQKISFKCSGLKSIELIKEAEKILNCKLPISYCFFWKN